MRSDKMGMRVGWTVSLAAVLLPSWAVAQGVSYQTLTLIDSVYLYMGLGMQWTLRISPSMANIPAAIVICGILYLLLKRATSAQPEPLVSVIMYFITSTMICVLFWPEAVGPLVVRLNNPIYPQAITALTAASGGFPDRQNARQQLRDLHSATLMPGGAWPFHYHGNLVTMTSSEVPTAYHLLLDAAVRMPIQLGVALNNNATQPFHRTFAFGGLYGLELKEHAKDLLAVEGIDCYMKALTEIALDNRLDLATMNWQSYVPWNEPVVTEHRGLSTEVVSESYRGTPLAASVTDGMVGCYDVWEFIWSDTDALLGESIPGTSDAFWKVVKTGTELERRDQVEFLVMRQMQRAAPVAVASQTVKRLWDSGVDIAKAMAAVNAAGVVKETVAGAAVGAGAGAGVGAFFGGVGAVPLGIGGGIIGGLVGAFSAILGASKPYVDQIVMFVKPALVFLHFMPHITGMIAATTIGLFPLVVAWSLFPGQAFKPLANYFLVLLFTQSAPLWYAISDAMSAFAYRSMGGNTVDMTLFDKVLNAVEGEAAGVFVGVAAIFVVPMIEAIILFGAWRAIGSALKGG